MSEYTLLQGDNLEVLKTLPDGMFRTCVTSPSYYGLRDYQTAVWEGGIPDCGHNPQRPDGGDRSDRTVPLGRGGAYKDTCGKCGAVRIDKQIGLEKTPEEYIERLVLVFREVRRTLADDGTLWLNLGDSFWGGKGKSAQAWSTENQKRNTLQKAQHQITLRGETRPTDGKHPVYKPKDLMMIPARVAMALQQDGWYLRSEIVWTKPNPMPESVRDRPTKSHEMIYLLSKNWKYYYDYEAILEPANYDGRKDTMMKGAKKYPNGFVPPDSSPNTMHVEGHERWSNKIKGRTEKKLTGTGYGGDGEGFKGHSGYYDADGNLRTHQFPDGVPARNKRDVWAVTTKPFKGAHFATFPPDLIEPCILAGSAEGDNVLDPFNGAGTTGLVSLKHGRNYYGIDLNENYLEITRKRLAEVQGILIR